MGFYGAQFMKKWLILSLFINEKFNVFWNLLKFFEIFEKSKNQKFTNSLDWNLKILSGLKLVFRALSFRSTDIKKVIFGQFDSKLIPWSFSETFYSHSTPNFPPIYPEFRLENQSDFTVFVPFQNFFSNLKFSWFEIVWNPFS